MTMRAGATTLSESQFAEKISYLKTVYKDYGYWNNYNSCGYEGTGTTKCPSCSGPCAAKCADQCGKFYLNGTYYGGQCFGFANKMAYLVFGSVPDLSNYSSHAWTYSTSVSSYYAGDYVRVRNGSHSIFITAVNGDTITYVDCNNIGSCQVKWDRIISKSDLQRITTYVYHYPGNTLTGTGDSSNPDVEPTPDPDPNPVPDPIPVPDTSSPIVHMDYPSGSYGVNNNIEVKGWIASNEPITWIMCDIDNYGQISLGMWDSPSEAAQYPQYTYFKRFNGVIEASKLTAGQTYGYHVFSSVTGGEYWGSFSTNGTSSDPTPSANWKVHLDSPTGTHSRYDHIELKGWLACNEKPAYIMSELVGKRQWVMNFWEGSDRIEGYNYFYWFSTVIDVNLLEKNQSYTIIVWSSVSDAQTFTFSTNLPDPLYYSVTFDANGGTDAPVAQSKKQLAPLTLTYEVPTRVGYTFAGWATSAEATAAEYQPGAEFTKDAQTTLYAVWEEGCDGVHSYNYTVAQNPTANDTGVLAGECIECGATTSIILPELSDECYTFNVEIAPDCENQGTGRYTWNVTEYGVYYFDIDLSTVGHSYETTVIAPTCTSQGYTIYTCATCGDIYEDSYVNATGHSFGNWSVGKMAGCEEDGYLYRECQICYEQEQSVINATGHSYDGGYCTTCGEKDPDYAEVVLPVLTLQNPTLAFEDEILYNVYFNVDDMSNVAEMGMVTFTERDVDGTVDNALEVIPGYVANADGSYTVHSNGIPAKMLGDAVYFKVYAKLSDGSYVYSGIAGYHAVLYANTVLKSDATSAKAKALVVAMLNYGAAAQVDFDYKADSLMNAGLTAEQLALVEDYSESMVAQVPAAGDKAGGFVLNNGYSDVHPTVSFEGAFSINYYFTPKYTPDDGVTFYYWNLNDFNNAEVLTPANATGTVKMTSATGVYTAPVEGIAAKQIDEPVYVAGMYTNGGMSYTTPVIGYSLGNYCKNIAANGNAFGAATAVYGYYAKAYFA